MKKIKKILNSLSKIEDITKDTYTLEVFADKSICINKNCKSIHNFNNVKDCYDYVKTFYELQIENLSLQELRS